MASGRDEAESVSEAKAQSGNSPAAASGCLILPSLFFLLVALVVAVIIRGAM